LPFLFGQKKKETIEDKVSELDKTVQNSMKEMRDFVSKVEHDVQKLAQHQALDPTVSQLVQELKQDLSSLKALLLSRYVSNCYIIVISCYKVVQIILTSHINVYHIDNNAYRS
jgi:wobble nucleotide-excising tRNase